jgi:FkbM family methyltransferase
MRKELFYNPRVVCERLGIESARRRRLARLKGTPARNLEMGHIDSLELLEICRPLGVETIYDIGANVGTWSLLAKAIFPTASIQAFEPLESCREAFLRNTAPVHGVDLHEVALGPDDRVATMHVGAVSDTSSLLPPCGDAEREGADVRELPVRSLDSFVIANKLPEPDLLKLDVQGYELEVLKGAPMMLQRAKAVICEVSFVPLYEGQCLFADVVTFMSLAGFSLRAFALETRTGIALEQTDVLFVQKSRDNILSSHDA